MFSVNCKLLSSFLVVWISNMWPKTSQLGFKDFVSFDIQIKIAPPPRSSLKKLLSEILHFLC